MGIGVLTGVNTRGVPLSDKLAEPGVVSYTVAQAVAAGLPLTQGALKAVAPLADTVINRVAPPVPGGLQMQKVVVVTTAQPITQN